MRLLTVLLASFFLLFSACQNTSDSKTFSDIKEHSLEIKEEIKHTEEKLPSEEKTTEDNFINNQLKEIGLIDIQQVEPSILVDLKYATTDNFTKKKLYFVLQKGYLQKDVANMLRKAQTVLREINPEYSLLIYDAARPVEVQQRMWDALDSIPVSERTKFVSNPKNHSIHNYGAAVDITIVDENNTPLDMGAAYDEIRQIAYPRMEEHFLKTGELTAEHLQNRKLLRKIMIAAGFKNIATEWWHFNACDRNTAKAKYSVFLKEPNINN